MHSCPIIDQFSKIQTTIVDSNSVTYQAIHELFNEIVDIYEITVRYRVIDVNADNYSDSLDFVEQMGTEVVRILRTVYNPSTTLNIYFRTMNNWTNASNWCV